MFVREVGVGPTVLLLHGTPSPAADWLPLAQRLAPRFRVLVPDLPGYGQTAPLEEPTFERVGDALNAMLDAHGAGDLAAIIGFSSGAYRALDLALRHRPTTPLVGALGGWACFDPPARALRRQLAARLAEPGFLASEEVAELMRGMMLSAAWRQAHPDDDARVVAWAKLTSAKALAAELEALAASRDLRPELGRLSGRLYARVGELDVAIPPSNTQDIVAHAPRAHADVVPGCGHALLVEDLAATCEAIVTALEQQR